MLNGPEPMSTADPYDAGDDWKNKRARRLSDIRAFSGSSFTERTPSICEDVPICWICLDSGKNDARLLQPCKCPRYAHAHCLARWQLQSAGSRKETHCEFCDCELPDWKETLTPVCGADAPAVMNVNFDGRTYSFEVRPGPDGYKQFTEAIRKAFSLPDDSELNITFTCDEPSTGSLLTLQGAGAYDAAVHCASVSAARRILQQTRPDGSALDTRHLDGVSTPVRGAPHSPLAPSTPSTSREGSPTSKNRRLAGFGRKLRSAICEFLTSSK
ncbi:hypothetical protein WJX72_010869 [[Myrmecia] bisecta]|uniref:RING-CH-type domain-containing protein n=1 Tax=[Myrmecia] bisecta TaxID=41462 RepID=A0AAW1Q1N4_9CHLO